MIERERRWKVSGKIPSSKIKDKMRITQTYANFNPDVRVRKITKDGADTFYHTTKHNVAKNDREEFEQKISEARYQRVFDSIGKKPVVKDRTIVDIGNGLNAEVDSFVDTGDQIVEVEFPSDKVMNSFEKPDWFGNEMKKNKSFSAEVFQKINNESWDWD